MRLLITGITGFVGSHMAEYAPGNEPRSSAPRAGVAARRTSSTSARDARGSSSRSFLDSYLRESRVKDITVKTDPARMRPSDVMILEGDPSKIAKLGWKVEIPFERTRADLLAYWRQRTSVSAR
jgi:GDP-D-mannose dehydratase